MDQILHFYMDESGSRKPDKVPATFVRGRHNAFAFGGVLINAENVDLVRTQYADFCSAWKITYPLHSVKIRNKTADFGWLRIEPEKANRFHTELQDFLLSLPVLALGCVIDRPGYDARYREQYGRNQWKLCRTAFSIAIERAAKHAKSVNRRLAIFPEQCSKKDDGRIKSHYDEIRRNGLPFDGIRSACYAPLNPSDLAATLIGLNFKAKSSPLVQIADLFLYPLMRRRYGVYSPAEELFKAGKVLDCVLPADQRVERGVKYSCFDLVD